jgi:hypothetical protein
LSEWRHHGCVLAGISVPGVSRSNGDLSELIRNPPCSIFVLMSRIVKRMNQLQRPKFSARLAVDKRFQSRAPRGSLRSISAEDEPCLDGFSRARVHRHELVVDRGGSKALAFARGQKQSRLIAAPITRVSNRAAATFNYEQLGFGVLSTSPPLNAARTGCLLLDSVEVPDFVLRVSMCKSGI